MKVQILNISDRFSFEYYSQKYKLFETVCNLNLACLEIRNLKLRTAEKLKNLVNIDKEAGFLCKHESGKNSFLLLANFSYFTNFAQKASAEISDELGCLILNTINNYAEYCSKQINIGNKLFTLNKKYIMGILNVTPDSFSDGGKYFNHDAAYYQAVQLINDGADIIDVGGESTRPGAEKISQSEELQRIIPVIERLISDFPEIIISVDTTKAKVAEAALKTGAQIVNDISGLTFDKEIIDVVKEYSATLVLMHIKGTPQTMQLNPFYDDLISEIYDFLFNQTLFARQAGVKNIIIDPGIGFGKKVKDNYEIINRLGEFKGIGAPILIGLSRKSFIGKSLNLNVEYRDNSTVILETLAAKNGASFIRTHNVKKANDAKNILNYIQNPETLFNV